MSHHQQEQAVGISTFVSPDAAGFHCIFKQRYTDFLVNEIPLNGQVLHLNEIATPAAKRARKERKAESIANGTGQTNEDAIEEVITTNGQKRSVENVEKDGESVTKRQKIEEKGDEHAQSARIEAGHGAQTIDTAVSEDDKASLVSIFGESVTDDILTLYTAVLSHPHRKARDHVTIKSETIPSKPARTSAHIAVRRIFRSRLETATLQDEPGRMTIRAAPPKSDKNEQSLRSKNTYIDKNGAAQQSGRLLWEDLGGEYLHFVLYKENKDTMEVLYFLASELKVKVSTFQFAGTKDRRGVTVQEVAAFRIQKERLMGLTKFARGWKIGGFEYKKQGLELGELRGNEFVITLRDCCVPNDNETTSSAQEKLERVGKVVREAAEQLQTLGFINFYGLQRFGTFKNGTHITGTKILQGDLEGAVGSILSYDVTMLPENVPDSADSRIPQEDIDRADAIRIWHKTQNANKARERMPRRFQAENAIIQFLGRRKALDRDWQGALMGIQRGLRLMYVHAYQSFIWNSVAVKRRETYGDTVVEGDLVVIGEKDDEPETAGVQVDQDGEVVVHPGKEEGEAPAEDPFVRARPLSKDEAESGKFDIFDLVLPLPGWDVIYPANKIGKFYEELMGSEEGGHLDPHQMRRAWKDASLSGGYRKMMARPLGGHVKVEMKLYSGDEQLAETDADRILLNEKKTDDDQSSAQTSEELSVEKDKIAAVLRLQLGSSQYATMALRELTKGGASAFKPDFSATR